MLYFLLLSYVFVECTVLLHTDFTDDNYRSFIGYIYANNYNKRNYYGMHESVNRMIPINFPLDLNSILYLKIIVILY